MDNRDRLFVIIASMLAVVHAFFLTIIGFFLVGSIMTELEGGDSVDSLAPITYSLLFEILVVVSAVIFTLFGYLIAKRMSGK